LYKADFLKRRSVILCIEQSQKFLIASQNVDKFPNQVGLSETSGLDTANKQAPKVDIFAGLTISATHFKVCFSVLA